MDLITKSNLKGTRGWTDGLIRKFLGEPDKLAQNPNYRSGPPMQLYDMERVTSAESTDDVAAALKKATSLRASRSASSRAAADRRRSELLSAIAAIQLQLPREDFNAVRAAAIRHYNTMSSARGKHDRHATTDDEPEFLNRITANYLRHQKFNYDEICGALGGQVGKHEAYDLLRERVDTLIANVYPELGTS